LHFRKLNYCFLIVAYYFCILLKVYLKGNGHSFDILWIFFKLLIYITLLCFYNLRNFVENVFVFFLKRIDINVSNKVNIQHFQSIFYYSFDNADFKLIEQRQNILI
jgi:hypothetical protein